MSSMVQSAHLVDWRIPSDNRVILGVERKSAPVSTCAILQKKKTGETLRAVHEKSYACIPSAILRRSSKNPLGPSKRCNRLLSEDTLHESLSCLWDATFVDRAASNSTLWDATFQVV